MTLVLNVRNVARLDNGAPTEFTLNQRGAIVGRSPTADWSLPDPRNHLSSRHFEISFRDGDYLLTDLSTNGTFVNGAPERPSGAHRLRSGDVLSVGSFEIGVRVETGVAPPALPAAAAGWSGWDAHGGGAAPAPSTPEASSGWGPAPDPSALGGGAMSHHWAPPAAPGLARPEAHRAPSASGWDAAPPAAPDRGAGGWAPAIAPPAAPVQSAWDAGAAPPPEPASGWSSAAPDRAPAPTPDDIWGQLAEGNVVDWARGGFGRPDPPPPRDPLGLDPPSGADQLPHERPAIPQPVVPQRMVPPPVAPPSPTAMPTTPPGPIAAPPSVSVRQTGGGELVSALLGSAGLPDASGPPAALMARAGTLLRRLTAGLVVMLEARARAKAQMGAESTRLEFQGNNPLKFTRSPEAALERLLAEPERGFLDAEQAVEDAFLELQSHQMATLAAMKGALRATLDRFSPTAIRTRAETRGLLARILPAARDAALWQDYEREFGGVAQGSDEAFMDVFAKEFRAAYEAQGRRER